jgi:hypothetical protein
MNDQCNPIKMQLINNVNIERAFILLFEAMKSGRDEQGGQYAWA